MMSRRQHFGRASFALAVLITAVVPHAAAQDTNAVAAWRVECTGDGKILDCRAVQQIFQRDTRQLVASVLVRYAAATKAAAMTMQLPLGLNLTEPVQIRVDNGAPEKQPIQTCTNVGCFVAFTINDKLMAAMRTGNDLKITVQDAGKKSVDMALPLLGFAVAFDKVK
jgi:invasion protein IalB